MVVYIVMSAETCTVSWITVQTIFNITLGTCTFYPTHTGYCKLYVFSNVNLLFYTIHPVTCTLYTLKTHK